MLRAIIPNGTNGHGRWLLKLGKASKVFHDCQQYQLEVKLSDEADILLDVAVRSSLAHEPVAGTLRPAPGISRYELLEEITPVIEKLNQINWHGVLETEECNSQLPQSRGAVNSAPIPTLENNMGQPIKSPVSECILSFNWKGWPIDMTRRAEVMLRTLLAKSAVPAGNYTFEITGAYGPLQDVEGNCLHVELGQRFTTLRVMLKCRGRDGSVYGLLEVPSSADRTRLYNDMYRTAERLNQERGWDEDLDNLPPLPAEKLPAASSVQSGSGAAKWRPALSGSQGALPVPPTPEVRSRKEAAPPRGPLVASSMPPTAPAPRSVPQPPVQPPLPDPRKEAAMPTNSQSHSVRLAEVLKAVLKGSTVTNGCFTGKDVVPLAREMFQGKHDRWYSNGCVMELLGHAWISRVGTGEYQVAVSFVAEHKLGLVIEPRPKLVHGRGKATVNRPLKKQTGNGLSLEDLLGQREELEQRIRAKIHEDQQELVEAVEQAKAGVGAARAAVVAAEARVVTAQRALDAYNQLHAESLKVLPVGVTTNPSVSTSS